MQPAAIAAEAWATFRRDRALLLPIAGLLMFLPSWALALLAARPPIMPADVHPGSAAAAAWLDAVGSWVRTDGGGYLLAYVIGAWGSATIYALALHPARPDVAGALRRGASALPRVLLAAVLVSLPVAVGLKLWVLPGVVVLARLMLVGPVLFAEPGTGAVAAIVRSLRLTRGAGLPLAALVGVVLAGGVVAQAPLMALDGWLRSMRSGANPVALALVDAGAAAASTAASLATALVAIAAYRRLVSAR